MKFCYQQKGVTLIELVIVLSIIAILSAGVVELVRMGSEAQLVKQSSMDIAWQGDIALSRMTDDIHAIKSPSSITTATSSTLSFTAYDGSTITYQLSGNQLMRNSQPLASHVQSVTFGYYNSSGGSTSTPADIRYITIALSLQDIVTYNFSTGVFLWGSI